MPVIDADTHVDETEATWDYLSQQSPKYVPATMEPPAEEKSRSGLSASRSRFWLVEGRIQVRAIRDDIHHPARPRRELEDLEGRIADMDKMGVDIQVLFPTFFIRYVAQNPLPELNLQNPITDGSLKDAPRQMGECAGLLYYRGSMLMLLLKSLNGRKQMGHAAFLNADMTLICL